MKALRIWVVFALAAAATGGCRKKAAPEVAGSSAAQISTPFSDDFERADLGDAWRNTGANYRIDGGRLNVSGAFNHPLWLQKKLPRDVVFEIDATSMSPHGDLKVELFGDGASFDPDRGGYTSTGYVFIFGGWQNTRSIIARNYEHDDGEKVHRTDTPVEPGRTYHFTITRKGATLDWQIDGKPFLTWTDPQPLEGPGHEFFAVNNWQANVYFDNVRIRPAP